MRYIEINEKAKKQLTKNFEKIMEEKNEIEEEKCNEILNQILNNFSVTLKNMSNKFKYIISGSILKKGKSIFNINTTCIWNPDNDGCLNFELEKKEFTFIINVFIIGI